MSGFEDERQLAPHSATKFHYLYSNSKHNLSGASADALEEVP